MKWGEKYENMKLIIIIIIIIIIITPHIKDKSNGPSIEININPAIMKSVKK